jgi:hypothetical protein
LVVLAGEAEVAVTSRHFYDPLVRAGVGGVGIAVAAGAEAGVGGVGVGVVGGLDGLGLAFWVHGGAGFWGKL